MKKTIITAALTGAVTPAGYKIPETPRQIADEAYEAWQCGAAVVHLHMRDDEGRGVMDTGRFQETIHLIRSHEDCDVIINCTSSGDNRVSGGDPAGNAKRMEHFRQLDGIEMGSYDAGSFNWMPATVENLVYLVNRIPPGATWSAFSVGAGHMPILYAALALGGHIRVGLEDNVLFAKDEDGKKIMATNRMLVERAATAVRAYGSQPATPAEARKMLGIPDFDGEAVRARLGVTQSGVEA